MGYTLAQVDLYLSCIEKIEKRRVGDLLQILQAVLFGSGEKEG